MTLLDQAYRRGWRDGLIIGFIAGAWPALLIVLVTVL